MYFSYNKNYELEMEKVNQQLNNHSQLSIDGQKLPPFPKDDENQITLQGIDVNKNGIRDDLEIWIDLNARNKLERSAMIQFVKDHTFKEINNEEIDIEKHSIEIFQRSMDTSSCLGDICLFLNKSNFKNINCMEQGSLMSDLVFNNRNRSWNFEKILRNENSIYTDKPNFSTCKFEIK